MYYIHLICTLQKLTRVCIYIFLPKLAVCGSSLLHFSTNITSTTVELKASCQPGSTKESSSVIREVASCAGTYCVGKWRLCSSSPSPYTELAELLLRCPGS